jgi:DNA-directed RNA polymerase specialized sigma24 family protein
MGKPLKSAAPVRDTERNTEVQGRFDRAGEPTSRERADLYSRLHARRRAIEQAVVARFAGVLSYADAEDLVSSGLERALTAKKLPTPDIEAAWFQRVVFNLAIDEIRRHRGRRQTGQGGALRHVVLLSELGDHGIEVADDDELSDPEMLAEAAGELAQRAFAVEAAREVLAQLDPEDVRMLLVRHVELPDAGRVRCAEAAGMTVEAWRHRYPRAWERFVDAMSASEPTTACHGIRAVIGELDAGVLANGAAKAARGRVDAHVLECTACRVFARESYRILVLTPVPAAATTFERIVEHGAVAASRNGEAIAAGGATGGGILAALFGSGGLGVGLKAVAIVCGVSVTAAGICGGVVATLDFLRDPPPAKAKSEPAPKRTRRIAARPTPTATPASTRTPAPRATPTPRPKPETKPKPTATPVPRTEAQPAAVPSSAPGTEFAPAPVQSQPQPAPVASGGGEFAP